MTNYYQILSRRQFSSSSLINVPQSVSQASLGILSFKHINGASEGLDAGCFCAFVTHRGSESGVLHVRTAEALATEPADRPSKLVRNIGKTGHILVHGTAALNWRILALASAGTGVVDDTPSGLTAPVSVRKRKTPTIPYRYQSLNRSSLPKDRRP